MARDAHGPVQRWLDDCSRRLTAAIDREITLALTSPPPSREALGERGTVVNPHADGEGLTLEAVREVCERLRHQSVSPAAAYHCPHCQAPFWTAMAYGQHALTCSGPPRLPERQEIARSSDGGTVFPLDCLCYDARLRTDTGEPTYDALDAAGELGGMTLDEIDAWVRREARWLEEQDSCPKAKATRGRKARGRGGKRPLAVPDDAFCRRL